MLLLLWLGLLAVCAGIGLWVLHLAHAGAVSRPGDRLVLGVWLGLMLLGILLLGCSAAFPLDRWMLAAAALAGVVPLTAARAVRAEIGALLPAAKTRWAPVLVIALLAFAERSIAVANFFDAGSYHVGLINWLSRFGTVPGMALIHDRLGFSSSWFALTAVLNQGPLAFRVTTVLNGFVLALALFQLGLSVSRAWRRRATYADWFALVALSILLSQMLKWDMRLSPSPDLPVLLLAFVVSWAMLVIANGDDRQHDYRNARIVPLVLAAGAAAIKVSALPLLLLAGLFYVVASRQGAVQRLLIASVVVTALLAPLVMVSLMSTGCLLFPVPFLCFDFPWSVGADAARTTATTITEFARGTLGREPTATWAWLGPWAHENRDSVRWMVLSVVCVPLLRRVARRLEIQATGWIIATACLGLAFVMYSAPTGRFALSYLVLLPAALAAAYASRLPARILAANGRRFLGVAALAALALVLALPLYKEFVYPKLRQRQFDSFAARKQGDPAVNARNERWLLLPNKIEYHGPVVPAAGTGFSYMLAHDGLCWDRPLPCAHSELSGVALLAPQRGIAGGFTRPLTDAR